MATEENRINIETETKDFPHKVETGLSKREYFAAMAMQGLLSSYQAPGIIQMSVEIADELITELNK